jgi:hypothetical protein
MIQITPIGHSLDLRCEVTVRIALGWDYARWYGLEPMPCKIVDIRLQEDPQNKTGGGTSVQLMVIFPDLETRDRFIHSRAPEIQDEGPFIQTCEFCGYTRSMWRVCPNGCNTSELLKAQRSAA